MKILKLLTIALFTVITSACNNDELVITGRMHYLETMGMKCWYLTDSVSGYNYEILSSENYAFTDGQKLSVKAKKGSGTTVCQVGEKINIISYKIQ
ncbi:hypothetical protein EON78_03395 [bacterium]|nr:MAG: hypothetical protein EON78_03395 [bacterium]